jgi:hypothetical protein
MKTLFFRDGQKVTARKFKTKKLAVAFCYRQNRKLPLYAGSWCPEYK